MRSQVLVQTRPDTRPIFVSLAVLFLLSLTTLMPQRAAGQGFGESFADLVDELAPAVVNITTTTIVAGNEGGVRPLIPEGSPLEDFFRDFMDRQQGGDQPRRASALGSGFIVSADGYIVTNNHVIEEADEIVIEFLDGSELPAEVIGTDPRTDIAVLKVDPQEPLPFVSFGDSDAARVGDWVLAIGNPLGQGFSVSAGIISARNRELSGSYDDFIQTDAAINRGNSGGPLFNTDGEVIGVNTAILSPNGGSIGIGFSMSSAVVEDVVDQLRDFGETRRGWLGVRIQPVDDSMAEALGLDAPRGALVADVPPGPAADGGILPGDVIVSFDGQDVAEMGDLPRIVAATEVGSTVRVVVFRNGGTQTLQVEVGRLESADLAATGAGTPPAETSEAEALGLTLLPNTAPMREEFGIEGPLSGVIVGNVDAGSEAYEKGLRPGDVITEINQRPIASPSDAVRAIAIARDAGRTSVLLLVRSQGQPRFVALNPNG